MATTKEGRPIKVVPIRGRNGAASSPPTLPLTNGSSPTDAAEAISLLPVLKWTPSQVATWVRAQGFDAHANLFKQHEVDGGGLLELDNLDLQRMGITVVGHRHAILRRIRTLAEPS